ncbi:MAG: hypothetical protein NVSMB24_07950 [Mucilaginibacter sp.]
MECVFDKCELWNGIALGLISSAVFAVLYHFSVAYFYYRRTYGKIVGKYIGQGYKDDDSGELNERILSSATIRYMTENKLEISVTHGGLTWVGEITMNSFRYGSIVFQYTDLKHKHFFGFKKLIVESDFNTINVIGDETKGYGIEVFTRVKDNSPKNRK